LREKRQHQRATLDVPVLVNTKGGTNWETRSVDISVGGMFLTGVSNAEIGTEVVLELELPKLGQVGLPGFIRWTAVHGFGVQFGLLGARETHAIGYLVRKQPAPL
jgi:hypothetical protein